MFSSPEPSPRLRLVGLLFVVVGVGLASPAIFWPAALDLVYGVARSGPPLGAPLDETARFGAALAGALTLGWGWLIASYAGGRAFPQALRHAVLAWFVVDSVASLALGFGWNALSNVGFLVAAWWATSATERTSSVAAPAV